MEQGYTRLPSANLLKIMLETAPFSANSLKTWERVVAFSAVVVAFSANSLKTEPPSLRFSASLLKSADVHG
jgi:hypothetical protein